MRVRGADIALIFYSVTCDGGGFINIHTLGSMAVCAGAICRHAVSASVHICTNLVFILVRRFGISDYVLSDRMIMLNCKGFGSDRGLNWHSSGAFLECVRKNTGNLSQDGGYAGRVSNWVLCGVC